MTMDTIEKTTNMVNETVKQTWNKIKKDPSGVFAINIYLGIIICFILFFFFYYLTWDLGDKRKVTCNNTVNNIKELSSDWLPEYNESDPRLIMDYNDKPAWTLCREADALVGITKNVDPDGNPGNDDVCKNIKLKDHYFMGCFNSTGCGDEWQSYVDDRNNPTGGTVLETVLNKGIRVVDFELFLKNRGDTLVVATGIPDEKRKYYLKGSYNQVPFSEILTTLTSFVDNTVNNAFQKHPLLVNLRIKSNDSIIYKKLGASFEANSELKGMIPEEKYRLKESLLDTERTDQKYENIVESNIKKQNGKIIFILNDNPLNQLGNYIENLKDDEKSTEKLLNYVCITDSEYLGLANAVIMESNRIINTHNKEETINDFKSYLGIALPDWSTVIKNPDFYKHMEMGCQISLMKFSLNDINLKEYFDYWKKQNGSIMVKNRANSENMDIVNIEVSMPMTTVQSGNLNPTAQADEATGRKMSGGVAAHAIKQYTT